MTNSENSFTSTNILRLAYESTNSSGKPIFTETLELIEK